jgi:hypothetical protein
MISIKTTLRKLRLGDVVVASYLDGPQVVTRPPDIDESPNGRIVTWETDRQRDDNCIYSYGIDQEIEVLFSSDGEIAERILTALAAFDPETLLAVRQGLCAKCGRVQCGRHQ